MTLASMRSTALGIAFAVSGLRETPENWEMGPLTGIATPTPTHVPLDHMWKWKYGNLLIHKSLTSPPPPSRFFSLISTSKQCDFNWSTPRRSGQKGHIRQPWPTWRRPRLSGKTPFPSKT